MAKNPIPPDIPGPPYVETDGKPVDLPDMKPIKRIAFCIMLVGFVALIMAVS